MCVNFASMKRTLFLTCALLLISPLVYADGFRCVGLSSSLKMVVYNHTDAAHGTRTPAIFIISNPSLPKPHQTLLTFSSEEGKLKYQGYGRYLATVDAPALGANSPKTAAAGTTLGQLKSIVLDLDFSYAHDAIVLANTVASIPGTIAYQTEHGDSLDEKVSCVRYRKGIVKP